MSSPVKNTYSSEKLAELLWQGDYGAFILNLADLPESNERWAYFHLLAIRVLMRQLRPMDALKKARQLSLSLIDPDLRKLASLESHYLDWLFNGRKQASLYVLDQELTEFDLNKISPPTSLHIREMRLRLTGTELILGMKDSKSKAALIETYETLIDDYIDLSLEEEAFDCIKHVIGIIESRPFPATYVALNKLKSFKELEMIKACPHREAHLQSMMARASLKESLEFGGQKEFKKQFKLACFQLNQLAVKLPLYRFLVEVGSVFLEYGAPRGKKLLIQAIRHLEAQDKPQETKKACTVLISWLKLRGEHAAIAPYLHMIEEPLVHRPTPVISHQVGKSMLRDLALSNSLVMVEASMLYHDGKKQPAISMLKNWELKIEKLGETVLLATLLAKLSSFYLGVDDGLAQEMHRRALGCYQRLGYPREAIDLVSDRLSAWIHHSSQKVNGEVIEFELNQISSILSVRMTTSIAESFANMYELAALAYLSIKRPTYALKFLREAQMVYQEFGMKPRLAFNLLYQAQVAKYLLLIKETEGPFTQGMNALKQAESLFKWMNCQPGVRQCQEDKAELETLSFSSTSELLSPGQLTFNLETIQKEGRETSLYQRFAKCAKAQENHMVLASLTQHLNQN